jgi:hypothetical protein
MMRISRMTFLLGEENVNIRSKLYTFEQIHVINVNDLIYKEYFRMLVFVVTIMLTFIIWLKLSCYKHK